MGQSPGYETTGPTGDARTSQCRLLGSRWLGRFRATWGTRPIRPGTAPVGQDSFAKLRAEIWADVTQPNPRRP